MVIPSCCACLLRLAMSSCTEMCCNRHCWILTWQDLEFAFAARVKYASMHSMYLNVRQHII